jgi:hypothetical protein
MFARRMYQPNFLNIGRKSLGRDSQEVLHIIEEAVRAQILEESLEITPDPNSNTLILVR